MSMQIVREKHVTLLKFEKYEIDVIYNASDHEPRQEQLIAIWQRLRRPALCLKSSISAPKVRTSRRDSADYF